jgi:hypothetical protein
MAQNLFIMKKKNQNTNDREQLKFENELKKLEISLKTGAHFHTSADADIPPEVERQFLKNIERFEEAFQSSKFITIYEKVGKPELARPENLSEMEISEALEKTNLLLNENGISLDSICPVDDRTMYTFIIDEFMKEETQDMKLPGHMCCYIYEEFHPNHEYDIKQMVKDVVKYFLKKSECEYENIHVKHIENYSDLELFMKSFETFTLHHFNINNVLIDGEKAIASFDIKFTGHMEVASGKIIFQGPGSAKMDFENGYWWIKNLHLPV